MSSDKDTKSFKWIDEFNIPFGANDRVVRYRHRTAHTTLILHHSSGPKVNASIVVPTEAHNNKGLPHTLEHLVFEGCDQVPYREYIEVLAHRCFSAPSNAYTSEDHTCYSIESVGPDGLLSYLPQLLRFVMAPTLKTSDFVTEIYHVDGRGAEQGVVMCEMQARENTLEELQEWNLVQLLYPGTPYANSYGGLTREIAKLTNEDIRQYHGLYYHPENVTIVVQGCIDEARLLAVLDDTEFVRSPFAVATTNGATTPSSPHTVTIPWLQAIPPLEQSVTKTVNFPTEDESVGQVAIAWRGPTIFDTTTLAALSVLIRYLNGNSSSALPQRFTHGSCHLASNIAFTIQEIKESKIVLEFAGVNVKQDDDESGKDGGDDDEDADGDDEDDEEDDDGEDDNGEEEDGKDNIAKTSDGQVIEDVDEGDPNLLNPGSMYNRVIELFEEIKKNGLDSEAMQFTIEKEYIKILEGYEEDPLGFVFGTLLCDIVFPPKNATTAAEALAQFKDIRTRFEFLQTLDVLKLKDRQYWVDLLDTWFIGRPYVEILMVPSTALAKEQSEASLARTSERCEQLGKEALEQLDRDLKKAIEDNKSFPESFKSQLPAIPDIKRIPFVESPIRSFASGAEGNPTSFNVQDITIPTQFIQSTMFFYIRDLPAELKPYLTIFNNLLFEADVRLAATGEIVPFKEVAMATSREVVSLDAGLGVSGSSFSCSNDELYRVAGSCTVDKFSRLVHWITHGLFNFVPTQRRLLNIVTNLSKGLKEISNDSGSVCNAYSGHLLVRNRPKSNESSISIFQQKSFLQGVHRQLKQGDITTTVTALHSIRDYMLCNNERIFVQVGHNEQVDGDQLLSELSSAWDDMLSKSGITPDRKRKRPTESPASTDSTTTTSPATATPATTTKMPYFSPLERGESGIIDGVLPVRHAISINGAESNNLVQCVRLPLTRRHPDFPAVSVLCDIFMSGEGEIRSKGYAYGFFLNHDLLKKVLWFTLSDSISPVQALQVFHNYLRDLPTSSKLTQFEVDTAISSAVYDFFNCRCTASELAFGAYISLFRGNSGHIKDETAVLDRITKVDKSMVMEVYEKYFKTFLDQDQQFLVMTVNPSSQQSIQNQMLECTDLQIEFAQLELKSLFE
ncbi:hypothetical protein SAMD00019534_011180 [Acytostelium subglobosum LB1]|uniref:hypothetical protein n=1 Tax=Acytostelium subglobosum LB1 TaxID=1410327 RepID=UPI0006451C9E|nr:hypothetical protein SAMD00019534_011180 [Acytostelium subglobosum LB1]GAM17943.1 hypothetical protein SAMD00019534_011180 [Acytostelium subglobosum LB1]|eukprot:XP_012758539.1 hypothetical protein SAMD00019534_011180 [Acytostelium subglobosum LB1]